MREGCRVRNQSILTQGNGSVMGYALESAEDHSPTLSCLLLPPLSCGTASLTPNTHCAFLTLGLYCRLPILRLSLRCSSLTDSVLHFSTRRGTSWGSRHPVKKRLVLHLWLKNTFVQFSRWRNVSLCCRLLSGPASLVSLEYWFIRRSEVIAAPGTLKQTRLCPLSKRTWEQQYLVGTYFVKNWHCWLCGEWVCSIWLKFKKWPSPLQPSTSLTGNFPPGLPLCWYEQLWAVVLMTVIQMKWDEWVVKMESDR